MHTDRQNEIIKASLELISQKGIQGLTIKNLSKKIGLSEAAIYRHFKNKTHILSAILDLFEQNLQKIFLEELKKQNSSLVKIRNILLSHFKLFSDNTSLISVICPEDIFKNEPLLKEKIYHIINNNDKFFTEIIKKGQEKSEIRDDIAASHISTIILGALKLRIKRRKHSDFSNNLLEEGEEFANSIKLLIQKSQ